MINRILRTRYIFNIKLSTIELHLTAILDKYYFDFLKNIYTGQTMVKIHLEYPYDIGVPNLLAGNYLGDWKWHRIKV